MSRVEVEARTEVPRPFWILRALHDDPSAAPHEDARLERP
jgi:hypothetical protein